MKNIDEIFRYFPNTIYCLLKKEFENKDITDYLQEIRFHTNRPIIIRFRDSDFILNYNVNQCEMLQILEKICNNSVYAYKNQICNGFITIKGGHRVGITGTAVIENDDVINIKNINSLNFRIAREIIGVSNKILNQIIDKKNNTIYNTIIVSPPGKGKTTILRDVIRRVSDGIPEMNFKGKYVGVVDERGELAAIYNGVPQNNIGIRTDVIENISKAKGIKILIRSMSPEIIACDEIGSKEDVDSIEEAFISGVKGIFTMHGKNLDEIKYNPQIDYLIETNQIEKVLFI